MSLTEGVALVQAAEDDAERMAEISKRAFDTDVEVGAPAPGGPPGYDSADFYARVMRFLDCYNILVGDEVVGSVLVDSRGREHGVVERIFVDPDHHNRGVATRASELLWERYPEIKLWTLGTPEWNVRARRFYEKLGFVQVGWDLGDPSCRGRWYEKQVGSTPFEMTAIGDLRDGMRNVMVEGAILEKSLPRTVKSRRRGQPLTVANVALGDDSGRIVVVLWNEQIGHVKMGERARVENGYVNSYRGVNQLNIGRGGRLITLI